MPNYSASNTLGGSKQNLSSSYKTLVSINCTATTRRVRLYELELGAVGTSADNVLEWDVSRMTAAGTGTTVTPPPLDPADAAAVTLATVNYTAEPTVTAASSLVYFGMNQRSTFRWVAAPGSELVIPATNLAGLVVRALSSTYTSTASATMLFTE